MFTETKLEEKITERIASFGMAVAEKQAIKAVVRAGVCDSLKVAADGVPVCGIVKFLAWGYKHLWNLSQNAPSS
jgi:hypothetical protein